MVEWSITAVLKTAVPKGTGGSNPSLSAINLDLQGLTNQVHESVHEKAPKCYVSGLFFYHVEPQGIFLFLFSSLFVRLLTGL